MDFYVYKTSKGKKEGAVCSFDSVDSCVKFLLETSRYQEIILSKPDYFTPEAGKQCKYTVEIYDTWRE